MYGTIARMRVRAGQEEQLREYLELYRDVQIPGAVVDMVFKTDDDPREFYLVAVFDSRESYWENARSPEQDKRYREMLPFLDGDPEWHDGEIIFSSEDVQQLMRH